jgi:hypothetical protein
MKDGFTVLPIKTSLIEDNQRTGHHIFIDGGKKKTSSARSHQSL